MKALTRRVSLVRVNSESVYKESESVYKESESVYRANNNEMKALTCRPAPDRV